MLRCEYGSGNAVTSLELRQSRLGYERCRPHWFRKHSDPVQHKKRAHFLGKRWEKRWAEGCHNRNQLWRELRAQGAKFAGVTLRRWFRVRFGVTGRS